MNAKPSMRSKTALTEGIDAADAGEFGGNEFGGGKAVLYAHGPDHTCGRSRPGRRA